jgi:hypothetical protein
MITELSNAVRSRQVSNPRTVLGFYATVLAILLSGDIAAVAVLASSHVNTFLIPWLLGFAGFIVFMLLAGVFVVTLIDPSKLMLGQITGTEYAQIHRVVLGDSDSGQRIESIIEPIRVNRVTVAQEELNTIESPSRSEDENDE